MSKFTKMKELKLFVILLIPVLFLLPQSVLAQDTFTANKAGADWSTGADWTISRDSDNPGTHPYPGASTGSQSTDGPDIVVIPTGTDVTLSASVPNAVGTVTITSTGSLAMASYNLEADGNVSGTGTITISTGTLNVDASLSIATLTCSGAAAIEVEGDWGVTTFTRSTSTVTFNGSSGQQITTATTFYNLTKNPNSNTLTAQANVSISSGTLTVTTGIFTLSGYDLSVSGSGSGITVNGGTLTFTTGIHVLRNFTFSSGTFNGGSGSIAVSGVDATAITISGGTFNMGSANYTYTVTNGQGSGTRTRTFMSISGTPTFNAGTSLVSISTSRLDGDDAIANTEAVINSTVASGISFYRIKHDGTTEVNSTGYRSLKFSGNQTIAVTNQYERTGKTTVTDVDGTTNLNLSGATLLYTPSTVALTVSEEWPSSTSYDPANVTITSTNGVTLGGSRTITGTLTLNQTAGNFVVSSGTLTINGTLDRKTSGSLGITGTLSYAATGSYLKYNTSAATTIGAEWPAAASNPPENVEVNISGGNTLTGSADKTVPEDLTLSVGTITLGANTLTVRGTVAGSVISGSATIADATTLLVGNSGSGTSYAQDITGTLTLNKLTVYKTGGTDAGNTVTLNGGQLNFTASGSLTITSGFLDLNSSGKFTNDPSTLTISSGGTLMTGGTSLTGITTISASSGKIEFDGSGATETLPTGITIGTVEIDNTSNVQTSLGTLTVGSSLALTNGKITTLSTNILRLGSSATISGTPGSSKMIVGPLQKAFASGTVSFDYPVGYNTSYRPATFSYVTNSVATSIIEVEAAGTAPGGNPPTGITSIATSHHYKVTEKGTGGTFTYNFTGTYTGTGFSPASRNQLVVQNAALTATPSYLYPHASAQTVNTGNETVTINDNLSALPTDDRIIAFGKGSADVKWDNGSSDGQWTTAANWDGNEVPSSGDDVVLDNSIVAGNYTVTLSGSNAQEISTLIIGDGVSNTVALSITNTNAAPLTINGSSGTPLQVLSDGVLTIDGTTTGGISMSGGGNVSFAAGSVYNLTTGNGITTGGSLTFNATSTTNIASITSGALKAATYGILNILNASSTLTVTGSVNSQNFTMYGAAGNVTINGGLAVTGNLNKSAGTGQLLVNGGLLSTSGSLTVAAGTVETDGTNGRISVGTTTSNTGTIELGGTGNSTFTGAFTNNSGGNVIIGAGAGTTTFSSTMANTGMLTPTGSGAGLVTFTGAYTGAGSITAGSGPAVTFSTTFTPSGSGTLTFGSQALTFNGNVTLDGGTFTASSNTSFKGANFRVNSGSISSSSGTFKFEGSSTQYVAAGTGSVTFPGLTINNSSGVTLSEPASAAGTFTLTSGLLTTTTTNLLTLTSSASVSGGSSSTHVNGPMSHTGTGTKVYPIGRSGDYRPVELLSVSGSSPVIRFEMVASDPGGTAGTGLNNISIVRYWQGSLTSGTFTSGQVKLFWGADDGVDGALTDLRVAACGTVNGAYADSGRAATTGNGTWGSITSLSVDDIQLYFTLGSAAGDNSLPVELSSFAVSPQFGSVNLEWVTQSEINNQGFNIYRKDIDEDSDWSAINSTLIPGKGSYSNESVYNYVDKNVAGGHTYQYKLESVSISGIRVEEKIVEAVVPVPNEYVVFKNYPNPFNPATKIKFQLPEAQNVKLTIYDMRGSKIKTLVNNNYPAGEHVVSWDATDNNGNRVASGLYVYRFEAGRFSKINKMILLK